VPENTLPRFAATSPHSQPRGEGAGASSNEEGEETEKNEEPGLASASGGLRLGAKTTPPEAEDQPPAAHDRKAATTQNPAEP